jgi:predicted dehydrogenase
MIRVGIIGLGYWGPNLLRNFASLPDVQVTAICELSQERLQQAGTQFPMAKVTHQAEEVLSRDVVDAVVIATPTKTHYTLATQALQQGLHTFVEKPLATSSHECAQLIELAARRDCRLFVGHVFLYTAAVSKLRELVVCGELGQVCYINSTRLNLGPIRQDVNALWDLAVHDISIILELMGGAPVSVNCQGLAYLNKQIHDVCTMTLHFSDEKMATLHVSWLDPNKTRVMTIIGSEKMAIYDDTQPVDKIKVFDKGVQTHADAVGQFAVHYRYGDTYMPYLQQTEPLRAECQHFIDCIQHNKIPKTDGYNGLEVVRVLEGADQSLREGGRRVNLQPCTTARPYAQDLAFHGELLNVGTMSGYRNGTSTLLPS